MIKTREYHGFEFQLDGSKGSYIEVTPTFLIGYIGLVGIDLTNGSNSQPYSWTFRCIPYNHLNPNGIENGNRGAGTVEATLHKLYQFFIDEYRLINNKRKFDIDAASLSLQEYISKL